MWKENVIVIESEKLEKLSKSYSKIGMIFKFTAFLQGFLFTTFAIIRGLVDYFVPGRAMCTVAGIYQKNMENIIFSNLLIIIISLLLMFFIWLFGFVITSASISMTMFEEYNEETDRAVNYDE